MSNRILILQSDPNGRKALNDFFLHRGDEVWTTTSVSQALSILEEQKPEIALIDLHLPEELWLSVLNQIRQGYPQTKVIITNREPDVRLELLAKEQGARVFLRAPFTTIWIERALNNLDSNDQESAESAQLQKELPKVRIPMRLKITFPYVLLALVFVLASGYLVSRYVLESLQERFTNQLIDAGKLSADWMVQEEERLLGTMRLLANTDTLAERLIEKDSQRLRDLALPVAINAREQAIEFLDQNGTSVLSLHHIPEGNLEAYQSTQGDTTFAEWSFVNKVLQNQVDERGDKFAGIISAPWGDFFYIAGPVKNDQGERVGVILIGKSLSTLLDEMREDTLAQTTIYSPIGQPIASTLFLQDRVPDLANEIVQSVRSRQNEASSIRNLTVASNAYSEILGPWEARGGEDLGVLGVALTQSFFIQPNLITRFQAVLAVGLIFLAVILIGVFTARQITLPLSQVVHAFSQVAEGNFKVKVPAKGNDEVMVLAHAFNYMVAGLQEGSIYRDLLGRTVSPQVREALRKSFASGELRLEGHIAEATVLISDIRNFTAISEKEDPSTILQWLNDYFRELVPIITKYGGVVDKFEGDALLAFFGILPTPLPPEESAYHACMAAVEMMQALQAINDARRARDEPALITGIGINTGSLTAGGLGTDDRLNYTIIGDTVNTAQRMQTLTRAFGESGAVIGETTLAALSERRLEFTLQPLGEHAFKGKSENLWVYRLLPSKEELVVSTIPTTMETDEGGRMLNERESNA
jgi:class 3 adenylate cyclase/ActR/RegA family two-component response regulator